MPRLTDQPVVPRPRLRALIAADAAPQARPPACGLLMIQAAILHDAATDLARIELQMAGAQSDGWVFEHGLAAICVLDRTIRLLQAQRPALLDELAEVVLSTPLPDESAIGRSIAPGRTIRLASP